jgi:hypothetical protein
VTVNISYFSLASIWALALFLAIMIPRALYHLGHVIWGGVTRKPVPSDRWLIAIALSMVICAGLALAAELFKARTQDLLAQSTVLVLNMLFFAAPAVLQVLRAFFRRHVKEARGLSHALLALAIISLPASMGVATAALLQSTAAAAATPADSPATSLADSSYFTDNGVANDPVDYPIATYLQKTLGFTHTFKMRHGVDFYRLIPTFTGFWIDETTDVLSFDGTDTFGILVSPLTFVRANWAMSLAVFVYKLMCALVLVAVTFDGLVRPLVDRAALLSRRRTKPA